MSKCKNAYLQEPTQLYELDGLLNVFRSLYSENLLSEREDIILKRAIGVYRELMVINEDLKK